MFAECYSLLESMKAYRSIGKFLAREVISYKVSGK
jgi:hypothetical protein